MGKEAVQQDIVSVRVREAEKETNLILSEAKDLQIATQVEYQEATGFLQRIKGKYKEIEDARKAITQPMDEAKKRVMELFRKPLTVLSSAETYLKNQMVTYHDEQEKKRREEEATAEAERIKEEAKLEKKIEKAIDKGDEGRAEELQAEKDNIVTPPTTVEVPQAEGIAFKEKWEVEVVNESLVPRQYLMPNLPMLNKTVQAQKGKIPIPGTRFKMRKIVASRSDKGVDLT